jgi:hypothetical protein
VSLGWCFFQHRGDALSVAEGGTEDSLLAKPSRRERFTEEDDEVYI